MPIATATTTAFLMIYCPSSVGTRKSCHACSGTSTSGEHTTAMWNKSSGITTRVAFGIKNRIPITHSTAASSIKSASKYSIPTVLAVSASASGLAGLMPSSFMSPNQKNMRNRETRATGLKVRWKKSINRTSIASAFLVIFL